jgi:AraC family transcriptional regulator
MGGDPVEEVLAKRFRIDRPPTLLARRPSRAQIAFSRMRGSRPMRGRSLNVPQEDAFSFHVPLSLPFFSNLWTSGRRREVPELQLGDVQLIDLRDNPIVSLDTSFDSLRFYITQTSIDEMADEAGIRRVHGLYAPNFGGRDLVMFGLAQALAGALERPSERTNLFSDYIALAFFAHIVRAYGSVSSTGRVKRSALCRGSCGVHETSSAPIWQATLRYRKSQLSADSRPAISLGHSSRQPASHPIDG